MLPSRKVNEPPTSGVSTVPPTRTAPSTTRLIWDEATRKPSSRRMLTSSCIRSRSEPRPSSAASAALTRSRAGAGRRSSNSETARCTTTSPARRYAPDWPVSRRSPDDRVRHPTGYSSGTRSARKTRSTSAPELDNRRAARDGDVAVPDARRPLDHIDALTLRAQRRRHAGHDHRRIGEHHPSVLHPCVPAGVPAVRIPLDASVHSRETSEPDRVTEHRVDNDQVDLAVDTH